ncbi:MAG: hypothetical protein AAGJ40_24080 [Planctomycetota bacterium]
MFTRPLVLGFTISVALATVASSDAHAHGFAPFGFQGFGFYQPYGITYRSSVPTPPYFAINPPVYYGTRHYRPYGTSPFASPPVRTAPTPYEATPGGPANRRGYQGPVSNPFICRSESDTATNRTAKTRRPADSAQFTSGRVQENPFVDPSQTDLISL